MMRTTSLLLLCLPLLAQPEAALRALAAGQYEEAEKALANSPDDAVRALLQSVLAIGRKGCAAVAPALLQQQLSAANAPALQRVGVLAASPCLDAPVALQHLAALEHSQPNDPDVLYAVARFHLRAWNDSVLHMYQRAPASWRVNQLSAEILEVQGKLPEAEAEFRKAIARNPNALNVNFRLGRVLLLQAKGKEGLEAARAAFARELELNPADAAAHFQLGQLANVLGDKAEARRRWQLALQRNEQLSEAALALARLDMEEKRYPAAIALLEALTLRQPKNEGAQYSLMMAYRNFGQMDKAVARKAILDQLQKPPEGEFSEFLKKLGTKP
jgi:tetratricopeptide (TPR) repeat protein